MNCNNVRHNRNCSIDDPGNHRSDSFRNYSDDDRMGRSNVNDLSGCSVSITKLTPYRMALLGSEGVRRYLATGYIPDDLMD